MTHQIVELFGRPTGLGPKAGWTSVLARQWCPYLNRRCSKRRKSQPELAIGTCTVLCGREERPVMICPCRLLERRQVFADCLHLLTLHEPGCQFHVVPEIAVPGGSVDYLLVSARNREPVDFVGIELQTLDTTGTVWPARERFLQAVGGSTDPAALTSARNYGMNWKMTAKTTLFQLHHKVQTFECISKHLVLVVQDCLLEYLRREFKCDHLAEPKLGHAAHFHAYSLEQRKRSYHLTLTERRSTDAAGIATALGLRAEARVELQVILAQVRERLSDQTRWTPA